MLLLTFNVSIGTGKEAFKVYGAQLMSHYGDLKTS